MRLDGFSCAGITETRKKGPKRPSPVGTSYAAAVGRGGVPFLCGDDSNRTCRKNQVSARPGLNCPHKGRGLRPSVPGSDCPHGERVLRSSVPGSNRGYSAAGAASPPDGSGDWTEAVSPPLSCAEPVSSLLPRTLSQSSGSSFSRRRARASL